MRVNKVPVFTQTVNGHLFSFVFRQAYLTLSTEAQTRAPSCTDNRQPCVKVLFGHRESGKYTQHHHQHHHQLRIQTSTPLFSPLHFLYRTISAFDHVVRLGLPRVLLTTLLFHKMVKYNKRWSPETPETLLSTPCRWQVKPGAGCEAAAGPPLSLSLPPSPSTSAAL